MWYSQEEWDHLVADKDAQIEVLAKRLIWQEAAHKDELIALADTHIVNVANMQQRAEALKVQLAQCQERYKQCEAECSGYMRELHEMRRR